MCRKIWLTAEILKLTSSLPLKNVTIDVVSNTQSKSLQKSNGRIEKTTNKIIASSMGEAPVYKVIASNFDTFVQSATVESTSNSYSFRINLNRYLPNIYVNREDEDNEITYQNKEPSPFGSNKNYSQNLALNESHIITFGKLIYYPTSTGGSIKDYTVFKKYKVTTDFLGLKKTYTVAEKNLKTTRVDSKDILNNFTESDEVRKYYSDPFIMNETVTHRITDFDKLMLEKNIISTKTKWQNASYIPHGDDGGMPLILVHGWNGDKGMTDPSKLLLWENSEFHYWHNFLAFYLTSEELQKKYHIYLYRYTSYKHIPYNAKTFSSLLKEISASTTDLGKGLNKNNGVTIMGHSMGGMVARAMIEDFNGLGANAEKLKKLITLDSPHRGSVGSMDSFSTDFPKDLKTHGAMDMHYDNFDNSFSSNRLKEYFTNRRVELGLSDYDKTYCNELYPLKTLDECLAKTANPYMRYLNDSLMNKDYKKDKYILYTAWTTHNGKWSDFDFSIKARATEFLLDFNKNKFPNLNFIRNGDIAAATILIGSYGYSSGSAESVGSSILSNSELGGYLNPKNNTFPNESTQSTINFYHKDIFIQDICNKRKYVDKGFIVSECQETIDSNIALITNSSGKDHPYKIPYRLFWDYDHETIFNGTAKKKDGTNRGAWDDYINSNSVFTTDTDKDTRFNSHRADYIKGAMKIRYGQEPTDVKNFNPLTYEPVFLVLEKDLLTSVTNGDIDEDKLPDEWEEANGLRWVNADDAKEDSDNDGLTNLQEYNNGTNSTDPQNEDSDGDGFKDGEEITAGTNPNDILDYPYVKFSLTLDSTTSTNFNLSWTELTGATKYKLCFSSIDEVSYETAQTCDSLIDGSFLSETTSTTLSFNGDSLGNLLQSSNDYYMRLVAYNDFDEVVGISSEVKGKLSSNSFSILTLKKTGQNISYTKYDDGHYEKGVAIKYTKEGVNILDRATGLLWQDSDDTNSSKRSWSDAKTYCEQFNGGNWRLPTRKELSSLVHYAYYNPSIDKLFKHTKADYYWSLDTSKRDATKVWVVSFSEGVEGVGAKNNSYYTRCIQNNSVLTANAGADQFVEEGQPVTLRATQSSREELIESYVSFDGDKELGQRAELTLEADDMRDGEHNITLVVTDQDGNENNNSMTVTIVSNNKVLKKTSQNISYAKYDDGYYEKGISLNYSQKNNDILDRTTGLMWQNSADTNASKKSWQEAKSYCALLDGNWRLPTRKELSSLVNYGHYNPSIHKIFTHTTSDYYWTVNTSIRNYDHAWIVSFLEGLESTDSKNSSHYTRCLQSNFAPTANAGVDLFIEKGQAVTLSASNSPRKDLIDSYLWESREDEIGYGETRTIPNLLSGRQNIYLTITDKKGKTDTDDLWVTIVANGTIVKKTGQTESYVDHDDGDYERGHSLSYNDHGNTVTDNTTGLEWKDDETTNSVKLTWEKANEYCSQGNNTWRLPTRRELSSLVDYGTYNPSIDSSFDNTASDYYWTIENSKRDNDKAWVISFLEGAESTGAKSSSYFVRCVNAN